MKIVVWEPVCFGWETLGRDSQTLSWERNPRLRFLRVCPPSFWFVLKQDDQIIHIGLQFWNPPWSLPPWDPPLLWDPSSSPIRRRASSIWSLSRSPPPRDLRRPLCIGIQSSTGSSPPRPNNRLHALHRLHALQQQTRKPITTVVLCSPVTLFLLLLLMSKIQTIKFRPCWIQI